ncbi:hypothetical protein ACJX0J_020497, partial [Zea mays]
IMHKRRYLFFFHANMLLLIEILFMALMIQSSWVAALSFLPQTIVLTFQHGGLYMLYPSNEEFSTPSLVENLHSDWGNNSFPVFFKFSNKITLAFFFPLLSCQKPWNPR